MSEPAVPVAMMIDMFSVVLSQCYPIIMGNVQYPDVLHVAHNSMKEKIIKCAVSSSS